MLLHNRISRKELEKKLQEEPFRRVTVSFYRYMHLTAPQEFRDRIYRVWNELGCFGRVYVAGEGINAQMSLPEDQKESFLRSLEDIAELREIPLKWALEDDGKSFYKLTIKVRPKLVADGLSGEDFDVTNVGKHLNAAEFHKAMDEPGTLVVDMRNHYESEIGHFENAICANSDTFSEGIKYITSTLANQKDKKILLYCTGGIRCEKASAYLKHQGFQDVNQLYGGIIAYANTIKELGIPGRFKGRNFVFDKRLSEDVDGSVISHCHQCGQPASRHNNCANNDCHLLFIQCDTCSQKYQSCCSTACQEILGLPEEQQKIRRTNRMSHYTQSKIFNRGRLIPAPSAVIK